jgi:predicted ArsR family transcriptional regulator
VDVVADEFSSRVERIGALAEPVRRALYAYVVAQRDAVGREQAAAGVDVAVHKAKFHLDRLVAEGLLEVEFRRLTGRTGQGAGRPAKLYRRAERPVTVSLPERRYDLAGQILASGIEQAARDRVPVQDAVRVAAAGEGARVGEEATADGPELERTSRALAAQGFEPRSADDGGIELANCPFDSLAQEHTALVCGLNEAFVGGVLDGLGCAGLVASLDPAPGLCCVRVRSR